MTLNQFVKDTDLLARREIDKVRLIAFYFLKTESRKDFQPDDVCIWFDRLGLSAPNLSRLRSNLRSSREFVRGVGSDSFRLNGARLADLESSYGTLWDSSEDVVLSDSVLPFSLVRETRGFIESLTQQINASYDNNVFDGCAVLMRRLIEVLLILSYEHAGIETRIQNGDGSYKSLSKIIGHATTEAQFKLTNGTKECLSDFRSLGNFSAHQIYYNAKRADIQRERLKFRAAVEELLYKAGIRK